MLTVKAPRVSRNVVVPRRAVNCRPKVQVSVSTPTSRGSDSADAALSIMASAAASALLAKVAALVAAAVPGALPTVLRLPSSTHKGNEKEYHSTSAYQRALAEKVEVAVTPLPAALDAASTVYFPAEWQVASSAAEWFDQHSQASAAGALFATVFVSDNAAVAHAGLLERLRRSFGTGGAAPVRFVFVRIAEGYEQRHRAAAAAAGSGATSTLARGNANITLARVSHTAALHGLDVALTSFLPDGVRAFPSLLLTAAPAVADTAADEGGAATASGTKAAPWSWSAATRVGELTQLVSDLAFISDLQRRRQDRDINHQPMMQSLQQQQQKLEMAAGWEQEETDVKLPLRVHAGGRKAVLVSAGSATGRA